MAKRKKNIEEVLDEEFELSLDEHVKVSSTLRDIASLVIELFDPKEVAEFMFLLTGDGDLETEQFFAERMSNHYNSDAFEPEDGYQGIADKYKELVKEYEN